MFDNFYTDNIFSNDLYLTGSTQFTDDLSIEKKRLCTTCKHYTDKNECSSMGKILYPDCPYCSRYKPKYIKRIKTKRCSVCGKVKSINKFYTNKKMPDGYQYSCRRCSILYSKEYQRNNYNKKLNLKVRECVGV